MSNVMAKEVYSLAEITGTLLDMRDNCFPKDGDTYDDPRRNEKHAALNIAIDLINNPSRLESMSNWISVKERLPQEVEDVLVFCKNDTITWLDVAHRVGGQWWRVGEPMRCVTHWQPLPEPPKELE